jgi:hypothetical protein
MNQMFSDLKGRVQQLVQDNATLLLTTGGVVGTVGTAVLAWRGGYKTAEKVELKRLEKLEALEEGVDFPKGTTPVLPELDQIEKIKLGLPDAIPPILAGSATIGSVIMAHRMSAAKAAALAAAYGLAERNLSEYKDKIQEKLTGPKSTAIRDEIQQDRVNENPPKNNQVIVIGSGEVLFYDAWSGRYFKSSVEAIRRAENAVNREIFQSNEAALKSFYDELDLPPVTMDEHLGWNIGNSLEIEISAVLTPESEPCLAIEFVNLPIVDFRNRY